MYLCPSLPLLPLALMFIIGVRNLLVNASITLKNDENSLSNKELERNKDEKHAEEVLSDIDIYREVLRLSMEQLWTQKIHIDEIKHVCDWLQRNGIELKRLPQILFHASQFLDEETAKIKAQIGKDLEDEQRTNPFTPSLIAKIRKFLVEIQKYVEEQKTLTPNELENMKRELTIAGEELDVASETIGEKVKKIEKILLPNDDEKYNF